MHGFIFYWKKKYKKKFWKVKRNFIYSESNWRPKEIKKDVPKKEAEEAKKRLEAVGAKVELK